MAKSEVIDKSFSIKLEEITELTTKDITKLIPYIIALTAEVNSFAADPLDFKRLKNTASQVYKQVKNDALSYEFFNLKQQKNPKEYLAKLGTIVNLVNVYIDEIPLKKDDKELWAKTRKNCLNSIKIAQYKLKTFREDEEEEISNKKKEISKNYEMLVKELTKATNILISQFIEKKHRKREIKKNIDKTIRGIEELNNNIEKAKNKMK